jgi:hypothetical protein
MKRKFENDNQLESEPKKLKTDPEKEPPRWLYIMPTFRVPSSKYGHWRLGSLTASFTAPTKDPSRKFEPAVCTWPPHDQSYIPPETIRTLLQDLYFARSEFLFFVF